MAKTKAINFRERVTMAVRRAIPQGSAQKAKEGSQKEQETVTKGKARGRGMGAKEFGK